MKRALAFLILLFSFLIWFVWNSAWHLPSELVMTGHVESPAAVRVAWDSGAGFNEMESAELVFGTPIEPRSLCPVMRIRRTGGKHPSARSADVRIKLIKRSEDDHPRPLKDFIRQGGPEFTAEGYLQLGKDGEQIEAPMGRDFTTVCFVSDERAGFVEIEYDGEKRLYDLYSPHPQDKWVQRTRQTYAAGPFTARMKLPRYDFDRLQIASAEGLQPFRLDSVRISSARGDVLLPVRTDGLLFHVGFSDFSRNTRQYFHPVHFLQQILFAALSAFLGLALFRFIRIKGGIGAVLREGQRPFFWRMFLGGLGAFGAWLLVYWPGHFTSDSVHIWWAAKVPGYFLYDHPVLNVLYYRFLQQFWDHFAVVGIVQIFFTSLLGSYIFYWLHKKGVPLRVIKPFYLLFVTSIPLGLYTITLWKDIPFALLLVFWAFWFVKIVFEKREGRGRYSRPEAITLVLLLIALCLFRYNGIVYLLVVPLGLAVLGRISPRKVLIGALCVAILTGLLVTVTVLFDKNDFVAARSRFFIDRMKGEGILEITKRIVVQYPTVLDINIFKKRAIWYDTWYRDRGVTDWHYEFAKKKGYSEWIRYMPCEPKSDILYSLLNTLNLRSTDEPLVYFTWNPFYLLYLLPLGLLFYRIFPLTAAWGYIVLSQVFVLLLVLGPYNYNWRYFYFLLMSLFFLIPILVLDVRCRWPSADPGSPKEKKEKEVSRMPKVSVIIPCFNHGAYLDEAVDSVLAQTFQDFEILVVDDGSTDPQTVRILQDYNRPKTRVIHTTNQGLAIARNNGIREARGDYILPLDADDKIGTGYLADAVPILDNYPDMGIVYSEAAFFGIRGGLWNLPEYSLDGILRNNIIFCSALFRKADWEAVGGYNVNMVYGWEDWDFWLSLIGLGRKVYRIPKIHFQYRLREASMGHAIDRDEEKKFFMRLHALINHRDLYRNIADIEVRYKLAELYLDTGMGFIPNQVIRQAIFADQRVIEFDLSDFKGIRSFRFDPLNAPVTTHLEGIHLICEDGTVQEILDYRDNALIKKGNNLVFETADPQIQFAAPKGQRPMKMVVRLMFLAIGPEVLQDVLKHKNDLLREKDNRTLGNFRFWLWGPTRLLRLLSRRFRG